MDSPLQKQILQLRQEIVSHIDNTTDVNTLVEECQAKIGTLATYLSQWIDTTAVSYKSTGCSMSEWVEDIFDWLKQNQFHIEATDPNKQLWKCHLSATGLSRNIVLTFSIV